VSGLEGRAGEDGFDGLLVGLDVADFFNLNDSTT